MSKKRISPQQGRGSVSRVSAPPHQLGVQFGTTDHVAANKKKVVKSAAKMVKKLVKVAGS